MDPLLRFQEFTRIDKAVSAICACGARVMTCSASRCPSHVLVPRVADTELAIGITFSFLSFHFIINTIMRHECVFLKASCCVFIGTRASPPCSPCLPILCKAAFTNTLSSLVPKRCQRNPDTRENLFP